MKRETGRLVLTLYALVGVSIVVFAALTAAAPDTVATVVRDVMSVISKSVMLKAFTVFIGLVILVWSGLVVYLAFRPEPDTSKSTVSLQVNDNGSVRVSLSAMETLVHEAIKQAAGLVDIKTQIDSHDDSITVKIEMSVTGKAHIPDMTMRIQRDVKAFIEEYSGIAVRSVEIMVVAIKGADQMPVPDSNRDGATPAFSAPSGEPTAPDAETVDESDQYAEADEDFLRSLNAEADETAESPSDD